MSSENLVQELEKAVHRHSILVKRCLSALRRAKKSREAIEPANTLLKKLALVSRRIESLLRTSSEASEIAGDRRGDLELLLFYLVEASLNEELEVWERALKLKKLGLSLPDEDKLATEIERVRRLRVEALNLFEKVKS